MTRRPVVVLARDAAIPRLRRALVVAITSTRSSRCRSGCSSNDSVASTTRVCARSALHGRLRRTVVVDIESRVQLHDVGTDQHRVTGPNSADRFKQLSGNGRRSETRDGNRRDSRTSERKELAGGTAGRGGTRGGGTSCGTALHPVTPRRNLGHGQRLRIRSAARARSRASASSSVHTRCSPSSNSLRARMRRRSLAVS